MNQERYLWDKSEPADAFVARLECLLADKRVEVMGAGRVRRPRLVRGIAPIATAAALVVALILFGDSGCSGEESNETRANGEVVPAVAIESEPTPHAGPEDGAIASPETSLEDGDDLEEQGSEPAVAEPTPDDGRPTATR